MPRQGETVAVSSANVVIPGPQGSTVLKNILLNPNDDGVRRAIQLHQAFGDLVHLQIGNRQVYLLFHPDDVQQVLEVTPTSWKCPDKEPRHEGERATLEGWTGELRALSGA